MEQEVFLYIANLKVPNAHIKQRLKKIQESTKEKKRKGEKH
jgi:hypothetical protein